MIRLCRNFRLPEFRFADVKFVSGGPLSHHSFVLRQAPGVMEVFFRKKRENSEALSNPHCPAISLMLKVPEVSSSLAFRTRHQLKKRWGGIPAQAVNNRFQ